MTGEPVGNMADETVENMTGEPVGNMTDETEVINSVHRAEGNAVTTVVSHRSPRYTDTEVTSTDRSVTFWNTAQYTDTTIPRKRKVVFEIEISGHGVHETGIAEVEYFSPTSMQPVSVSEGFTVPDKGLPQYDFIVKTNYFLYDWNGHDWEEVNRGGTATETAVVRENRTGG